MSTTTSDIGAGVTRARLRQLFAATLLAGAAALHIQPAHAAGTQFALTCVGTETSGTINFQYRWGATDEWQSSNVTPGRWKIFTYRYRDEGENRAPQFEVRYDDDMSSRVNLVRTKIASYAARTDNCEREGYTINFVNRGGELFLQRDDLQASLGTRI
jgi:hypothetical protein